MVHAVLLLHAPGEAGMQQPLEVYSESSRSQERRQETPRPALCRVHDTESFKWVIGENAVLFSVTIEIQFH